MKVHLTKELMEREVMTDARLDELARRFVSGEVRELLGVRFDQYLEMGPDLADELAERMRRGLAALRRREDEETFAVVWTPSGTAGPRIVVPVGRN